MRVADWTAITGIVVSGVVGPAAGALFAVRHQTRAQRHERELMDLEELRALLVRAAVDLREALGVWLALATHVQGNEGYYGDGSQELYEELRALARKANLHTEEIEIRLGARHPVTVAHAEADGFLADAVGGVIETSKPGRSADALRFVDEALQDPRLEEARQRFMAMSHALVASRVRVTSGPG